MGVEKIYFEIAKKIVKNLGELLILSSIFTTLTFCLYVYMNKFDILLF